jgi:acyl-CoA hydrolase
MEPNRLAGPLRSAIRYIQQYLDSEDDWTKPATRAEISRQMRPHHANGQGNVFGGDILKYMDEAGAIAAERYAENDVLTASITQMSFLDPVSTDDVLNIEAEVVYTGDTSLTVEVGVYGEDTGEGSERETANAYITYVAQDEDGNTTDVPDLAFESIEQGERYREAEQWVERALDQLAEPDPPEPDSWDIETVSRMRVKDTTTRGNVMGGEILKKMDEVASIAAERYAENDVVTASLDTLNFEEPVYVDDLLVVSANVDHVGDTSMTVAVDVQAEDPPTRDRRKTGSGYLTFVALDDEDRPTSVPPLDEVEDERYRQAKAFKEAILDEAS